jgi:uncharacterized protein YggL (DUF469 family)
MSEKQKSTKSGAVQVKNRRKTNSTEEKYVIRWLEKSERIVDTCRNVRFVHSRARTIRENADRVKKSAKSGNKVLV